MTTPRRKFRLRITPSIIISMIALVVALSSSATAALVITGKNIKNNAVASKHIKPKAVKAKHINPKAVKGKHLAPGVKKKLNKVGTPGADGADGVSGYEVVRGEPVTVQGFNSSPSYGVGEAFAVCPAGKRALGGGAHWGYSDTNLTKNDSINVSGPRYSIGVMIIGGTQWSHNLPTGNNANSWYVAGRNGDDNDPRKLTAWVICANVS